MRVVVTSLVIGIILAAGVLLFNQSKKSSTVTSASTPSPTISIRTEPLNITASFKIITESITRSFDNPKYHNQSADVYIEISNPTIVHVKKKRITWADFFNTLPMKLTQECLTTGDGETYCNVKDGALKFFLNDIEDKNLLEKEIKGGEKALIKFSSF